MAAYYNEIDAYAAQWLRNLIAANKIAPGDVDERSIADVRADDLRGYRQCHFFAGIGVWSYALRQAGWPDEEEIWTGSCPCQPFSDAGAGEAFDDERDLWPFWFPLIRERRPCVVLGEQVASRLGLAWLDALHADLEGEAYTVGAVDTCSAGFGSPNIRQRLYWVDESEDRRTGIARELAAPQGNRVREISGQGHRLWRSEHSSATLRLGEPSRKGLEGHGWHGDDWHEPGRIGAIEVGSTAEAGESRGLADALLPGCGLKRGAQLLDQQRTAQRDDTYRCGTDDRPGPLNGFWRAADWLCCTDGKWRPVRPGSFPLVTGAPGRLGRLRAYGNAINAQVAAEFVRACMDCRP